MLDLLIRVSEWCGLDDMWPSVKIHFTEHFKTFINLAAFKGPGNVLLLCWGRNQNSLSSGNGKTTCSLRVRTEEQSKAIDCIFFPLLQLKGKRCLSELLLLYLHFMHAVYAAEQEGGNRDRSFVRHPWQAVSIAPLLLKESFSESSGLCAAFMTDATLTWWSKSPAAGERQGGSAENSTCRKVCTFL